MSKYILLYFIFFLISSANAVSSPVQDDNVRKEKTSGGRNRKAGNKNTEKWARQDSNSGEQTIPATRTRQDSDVDDEQKETNRENDKGKKKSLLSKIFKGAGSAVAYTVNETIKERRKEKEYQKQQRKMAEHTEREEKKLSKKKIKTRENYIMEKTSGTVYVFGISQGLGKNEVYITEINTIDSLALQKQTRFLPFRSSFSLQLQQYTEGVLGQTNQTVSTFFNVNRGKLAKTLSSVKKRYLSNANKTVVTVTQDQFHFVHPLDLIEQSPMQETE